MLVPRGSPEETRRILNEIEKINMAFGYTRKSEVTVPRQSVTPQNYFYPRPVVGPSFLQNRRPTFDKSPMRGARTRTWSPFEETTYYYSVPYVRVPLVEKRPLMGFVQDNNARTLTKNLLRSELVTKTIEVREPKALVNSIDVKETEPEEPEAPISEYDSEEEIEQEAAPELVEGLINVLPGPNAQEIEDAYDSLSESNEALESAEEEQEEEIPATTINPPLVNDKFLHQEFLQKTPMAPTQLRGFNFSNPFIKGISDRFNKNKNCSITEEHRNSEDMEALSEKPLPDYEEDDAYIEGSKAPWSGFAVAGPANQKDVLKGGGLIIQRLRVRNGSIAIAVAGKCTSLFFIQVAFLTILLFFLVIKGPGGVATAGSGKCYI